eukprot:scaffold29862_cov51-Phaeocystis_antarctica.AAC.5
MEEEPSVELLMTAIRRQTIARNFVPVCMGSAFKNKVALPHYLLLATCHGVHPLLEAVIDYLPAPTEVENSALDLSADEAEVMLSLT